VRFLAAHVVVTVDMPWFSIVAAQDADGSERQASGERLDTVKVRHAGEWQASV
jgi:hypothetical protein